MQSVGWSLMGKTGVVCLGTTPGGTLVLERVNII